MKKSLIILLLILSICSSTFATVLPVEEIIKNHWSGSYIKIATQDNWMYFSDGESVDVDLPATREQVIYMIMPALKIAIKNYRANYDMEKFNIDINSYKDVNSISEFAKEYFQEAISYGIIKGYENNTLKPQGNITRAELATIISRVAMLRIDQNQQIKFKDSIPNWCYDAIINMARARIINGYDDGTFKASRNVTIAETVTMISRWAYEGI